MLFPAPIPPPIRRRTGLLSLCATGAITSVHRESSFAIIPIAFSSSTNVENTLATFKFFVTLSNLCSLYQQKTQGYLNNLILQKQYTCISNNYNIQLSAIFFFGKLDITELPSNSYYLGWRVCRELMSNSIQM